MEKLIEFLKAHKHALIWTICYAAAVYLILFLIFNFNILSPHDWKILSKARFYGFPGFVFIILSLSAIPLYIASTSIIIRNKKPLISFKKEEKKEEEKKAEEEKKVEEVPLHVPAELREAFIRAKKNIYQKSGFNKYDAFDSASLDNTSSTSSITAPENFDIPDETNKESAKESTDIYNDEFDTNNLSDTTLAPPDSFEAPDNNKVPSFKKFDFSDNSKKKDKKNLAPENKEADLKEKKIKEEQELAHKDSNQKTVEIEDKKADKILQKNKYIAIVHDDSDFWIADNQSWFATGKQKESPVKKILDIAKEKELIPAIILKERNIMNLDIKIKEWDLLGIKTVYKEEDL